VIPCGFVTYLNRKRESDEYLRAKYALLENENQKKKKVVGG
jgi:hypothetical protein